MPQDSTTEKSVTLHITHEEFQLLATLMAPLYFDESGGSSVWVSSHSTSGRRWVVRDDDDRYAVVTCNDVVTDRHNFPAGDSSWSFPVTESILVSIGKMHSFSDDENPVTLTLADTHMVLQAAGVEMCIPQNHKVVAPPITPAVNETAAFSVEAVKLWCVLSEARRWPASGECNGLNPPMMCHADPDSREMVITVDWSAAGNGVCTYRLPVTWLHDNGHRTEPLDFALPHSAILEVLRDIPSSYQLETVLFRVPDAEGGHLMVHNHQWEYYVPVVRQNKLWGQDLSDVMGDTRWKWVNAGHLLVWPDGFDDGPIRLSKLPHGSTSGPYEYRATCVICDDVVANNDLYDEINAINSGANGFRLVVDKNRVIAVSDYTEENYAELGRHLDALARNLRDIGRLLHPLSVSTAR